MERLSLVQKYEQLCRVLNEQPWRQYLALEAPVSGNILQTAKAAGVSRNTIKRGLWEFADGASYTLGARVRKKGAGGKYLRETDDTLVADLGPLVSGAVAVAVGFIVSPAFGLAVLVFWTVLQQFENNLLVPYVRRSQMSIPPLLVIFAIITGFTVGGILGALVAVPLCVAVLVVFVREVAPVIREWTGGEATEEVEMDAESAA